MRRAFGLVVSATVCWACNNTTSFDLVPPWADNEVGVLALYNPLGTPLLPAPLRITGHRAIALAVETDQPTRVWAETYPGNEPSLASACTFSHGAEGVELPSGRAYVTLELDPGSMAELLPTSEARPVPLRSACPPAPVACGRVQIREERPATDGLDAVDLWSVAILGVDRYLVGGITEVPEQSYLGILDHGILTRIPSSGAEGPINQIVWQSGLGGWATTNQRQLIALDPSGQPTFVSLPNLVDELAFDPDDGSAFGLNQGSVLQFARTASTGRPIGGRSSLVRLGGKGPYLYAHDGLHLEVRGPGGWMPQDVPADALGFGLILGMGARAAIFGPRGVLIRQSESNPWTIITPPNKGANGGWLGQDLLVMDDLYQLTFWDNKDWCELHLGTRSSLKGIAVSPDEKEAIVVGSNNSNAGPPLVVHLYLDD